MTTHFTGGCMCGAIRYECSAAPIVTGNCLSFPSCRQNSAIGT
ncbi:hypothetical protein [Limnofasciculus baicalensis]|nr:hypothetical protein [Limnofasciculus baicalensis]